LARCTEAGIDLTKNCYPTPAQWKALLELNPTQKICIVCTFIFSSDPLEGIGGLPAAERYEARLKRLGIRKLTEGTVKGLLLGAKDNVDWEVCSVIEFPNNEAFVEYFFDDLEAQRKRANFTGNVRITIVESAEEFS